MFEFHAATSRRSFLSVGGPGLLAGTAWDSLASEIPAEHQARTFGQVKSVIFVTLYGGPPQTDTFDMKPDAPVEARGPFKPIPSSVVDLHVCEHLPRLSRKMHLGTLARTLSHTDTAHGASLYTHLTGWPHRINNQNFPSSPDDHPHYGAIVSKLRPPQSAGVPASVIVGGRILPQFKGIGQTAGYLGKGHAPFVLNDQLRHLLASRPELTRIRVDRRQRLLTSLQQQARVFDQQQPSVNYGTVQERAMRLLGSENFIPAFDVSRERESTRLNYGKTPMGRYLLLARRLVEAGVPVIQISDIPVGGEQHWDLHYANIFDRLKKTLLPPLDQSLSALLDDLEERGLLDSTLVICGGEFGRTPWLDHISNPPAGGRQHWPHCYSLFLAGGGIRRGQVFGKSDELAAYPLSKKVGPWDLGATTLHLMGIDPHAQVSDRDGQPRAICRGDVVEEWIGS